MRNSRNMGAAALAGLAAFTVMTGFGAIRAVTHDNYGGSQDAWQIRRHGE